MDKLEEKKEILHEQEYLLILEKERNPYRYMESDLPSDGTSPGTRQRRGKTGTPGLNGRKKTGDGALKTVMENIRKSVKDLF